MLESDTYCIDILTQVAAATKALKADLDVKLTEASTAISRLMRA